MPGKRADEHGGKGVSVLIKGMEMPTSCADCRLMADGWCYSVGLEQREKISTVKRPTWCPLVPVPPHGDLIDRGYAIATACFGRIRALPTTEDGEDWIRVEEVRESIKNAPTIIPAEEGE